MTISCLSVFGEVSSTGKSLGRFLPTSFCLVDCLSILTSKISKIIHVTSRALLSLNSLTMASQATKQLKESWRKAVSRGIKALRVISFYPSDFIYSHRHTYSCFCLSVALHSERPAHLRPNMHPSEEMLGCFQQHHNTSSPLVISVALQETLGWDLKEHKCFTVNCSPETHVLRLRVSAVPQRCLTLLAWRQGKNYRWLPQKLSQAKAGSMEYFRISPARSSGHQQYMAALHPSGCCVWGWSWNWFYSGSQLPFDTKYNYRINKSFAD